MHKAFVHGAHHVSDFSGFAGHDEGIPKVKVKAVVDSVMNDQYRAQNWPTVVLAMDHIVD